MSSISVTRNSTIVRNILAINAMRLRFALGSWLTPKQTAERAARLFATPFASSRKRAQTTQADAQMRRSELHIGGRTIATYIWGDPATQPYVLFAHGWSSFGLRVLPWVPRLRALGYAVVTFDQAGHGASSGELSTLPDFADTLREVGRHYGNAALAIAHSFGAPALALAQGETWQAERSILIAPAADLNAAVRRFFRFARLGERLRDRFYAWYKRRTGVDAREIALHTQLSRFAQPALIIHDLEDREVPWSEGEFYARHWPGARLLTTAGLGHNRIFDDAGVIEQALRFARGEEIGERVIASPNLAYGMA
jgi:pimeloyl-ACP methyl ester carboxylesterase